MSGRHLWAYIAAGLAVTLSCASAPPLAPAGRSGLEGRIRLVPHEGVTVHGGGGAYGDRRMKDVQRVDYDRPGFAVVWVEPSDDAAPPSSLPSPSPASRPSSAGAGADDAALRVTIRDGRVAPMLDPAEGALRAGRGVEVRNASEVQHVVSLPAEGVVHPLAPGEVLRLEPTRPGPQRIYLLDAASAESLLFVAPGPFAVPRPTGQFSLGDLPPGPTRVHAWHPRFPPTASTVELRPDVVTRLDLVLGVGHSAPEDDAMGPAAPAEPER